MFARIRRLVNQFFSKSRKINNEPLNRVSLIVIILIDIFILVNVFTGLDDISRWHLSPSQAYPCYFQWQTYRTQTNKDKDYEIIRQSLLDNISNLPSQKQTYQQNEVDRLGKVSSTCLQYGEYIDKIKTPQNQQAIKGIDQRQAQISNLKQSNNRIRAQYDSTLLDKLAGQAPGQSINQVPAEKAKQELDKNNVRISQLEKEISNLKNQLLTQTESKSFIAFLQNRGEFATVEQGYKQASFWYPSIQLAFQSLFLLPLIFAALLVHQFSQRRGYGLIALISWHLLVIFFIPLVLKIFEFLQVGAIFQFFFDVISAVFGSLLFLVSYVYILLIPLIGFGIIKFFQKIVLNPKLQAVNRIQKSRCVKCAKKIRANDAYCPHCGYYQYIECQNCHNLTYKHLPHCKHCGTLQDVGNS
ncbi:hypothetical protein ACN23B_22245 [Anabaena sp. FACHB-709]|uniref:DZANK-type domain-containing protein n=2 Tax=Nostocaceae TaxID=1162 RepID=A0A1Z4KM51_ANAVA|nr:MULTISPECIES: hypothetical protein [Nostocaceae]BAY70047.1 hypothetical protein NIES23_28470 [Trichormus variabilis NIES-23]HBW32011.1 hypothetical protein [Nostoc sp. UBA8866]MBD2174789.1 hypothetical protein [Anabaena cylindrica FACHB-318]MBD2266550.1 hypothetical protein [Anabaena sp. FACHB-709]MBD2276111.1 hypothetical protein [Nostoc sp. PCC 7120 = FACHB-418]